VGNSIKTLYKHACQVCGTILAGCGKTSIPHWGSIYR
jgi:hypothetical protein